MPGQKFVEAGPWDRASTMTPRQPLAPGTHLRDRPQTWVRPRMSKLVPSVSGCPRVLGLCGRKSTRRVLSGWRVSPYRARRLPRTDSTRLASSMLSNAISASSANRTRVHSPLRRGFTSVSNHSSSTWCKKTFERLHPLAGSPRSCGAGDHLPRLLPSAIYRSSVG